MSVLLTSLEQFKYLWSMVMIYHGQVQVQDQGHDRYQGHNRCQGQYQGQSPGQDQGLGHGKGLGLAMMRM